LGKRKLGSDTADHLIEADGWLYHRNSKDFTIYKMSIDGSSVLKISDHAARNIIVLDDWVYYTTRHDNKNCIFKVRKNGTGRKLIDSQETIIKKNNRGNSLGNIVNEGIAVIQDDWIYFSSVDEKGHAYRFHVDDKALEKINHDQTASINIAGPWMYYRNLDDYGKLYRIKTDGTERQLVK
jgi:hypothetical protein